MRRFCLLLLSAWLVSLTGCWVPFHSPGIPATQLPDSFRLPSRTAGDPLNFAELTIDPPADYVLGPDDVLELTVPGLYKDAEFRPIRAQIMASGEILLPLVGPVHVAGDNLLQAQQRVNAAYADGVLENPQANLSLAQKSSTSVLVLGKVKEPGVKVLPKYENDVGHALASAGGLAEDAADIVEVHRRPAFLSQTPPPSAPSPKTDTTESLRRLPQSDSEQIPPPDSKPAPATEEAPGSSPPLNQTRDTILRIPLRRTSGRSLSYNDIVLHPGDVVVVPSRRHEVFYVVGKLGTTNTVRFTIGDRERELGVGFVLPREREIDVVTAVAMAGYIDPIDSPSTVTLHRILPDGSPLLILVDLIEARSDPRATVLVQPGDIIYLNPDGPWYFRRTMDRIFPDILLGPYDAWIRRAILGRN